MSTLGLEFVSKLTIRALVLRQGKVTLLLTLELSVLDFLGANIMCKRFDDIGLQDIFNLGRNYWIDRHLCLIILGWSFPKQFCLILSDFGLNWFTKVTSIVILLILHKIQIS